MPKAGSKVLKLGLVRHSGNEEEPEVGVLFRHLKHEGKKKSMRIIWNQD